MWYQYTNILEAEMKTMMMPSLPVIFKGFYVKYNIKYCKKLCKVQWTVQFINECKVYYAVKHGGGREVLNE